MTKGIARHLTNDELPKSCLPGYASPVSTLPENSSEELTRDSISLDNSWSRRSLERRYVFQNLQNRYYQQILCGCTNPRCQTPTCLSRQKRLAKGPFRPFTALSARTLASVVASEDHPENGLCPHTPAILDESYDSDFKPTNNRSLHTGKAPSVSRDHGKRTKHRQGPESSETKTQTSPGTNKIRIERLYVRPRQSSQELARSTEYGKPIKIHEKSEKKRRDKDPKSFTQNLFDTAAMRMLQFARIPEDYLNWTSWTGLGYQTQQNDDVPILAEPSKAIQSCQGDPENSREFHEFPTESCSANVESVRVFSQHSRSRSLEDGQCRSLEAEASKSVRPQQDSPSTGSTSIQNSNNNHQKIRSRARSEETCCSIPPICMGNLDAQSQPPSSRIEDVSSNLITMESSLAAKKNKERTRDSRVLEGAPITSRSPQSLSHFTDKNIVALLKAVKNNHPDLFAEHCLLRSQGRMTISDGVSHFLRNATSYKRISEFSIQSMRYILSNTQALLQSFLHYEDDTKSSRVVWSYSFHHMVSLFRNLRYLDFHPESIIPSLWISVGSIYLPNVLRTKSSVKNSHPVNTDISLERLSSISRLNIQQQLSDLEACHIIQITLAALVASVPRCNEKLWKGVHVLRTRGQAALPPLAESMPQDNKIYEKTHQILDALEDEMTVSLTTRLLKAISTRVFVPEQCDDRNNGTCDDDGCVGRRQYMVNIIIRYITTGRYKLRVSQDQSVASVKNAEITSVPPEDFLRTPQWNWLVLIELLRSVILKKWDGKAWIPKCSAVAAALELLHGLFMITAYDCLTPGLPCEVFPMPFMAERLDMIEMPLEWANSESDSNTVHLLSYSFLFPPSMLISYFRALNHDSMNKAFNESLVAAKFIGTMDFHEKITRLNGSQVLDQLKVAQTKYLVLEIGRQDVLIDTMDQLWRRQKRELQRPLKVRMGLQEGEEGLDHGGVQQEFFRVAVAAFMNPDYGVFTTDSQTHMSWFAPFPLEPLYKYELVGLLTSLAVYNGLTLPFTFPLALYRSLLHVRSERLMDIEDGWPELTKGLRALQEWTDGDVEEVFMREYAFSMDVFGTVINVDMEKAKEYVQTRKGYMEANFAREQNPILPSSPGLLEAEPEINTIPNPPPPTDLPSPRPSTSPNDSTSRGTRMVTNANRDQYIQDYVIHIVHNSVKAQFACFASGFFSCFSEKLIKLFTPHQLKALVEGLPNIPIDGLEAVTTYEGGYNPQHPAIRMFWSVVRSWDQEKVRRLLEFVTASDRLPVGGMERVVFVVQKNGDGEGGRLPTSHTCFGRLLLPEYGEEGILRERLERAIENSKGFGMA